MMPNHVAMLVLCGPLMCPGPPSLHDQPDTLPHSQETSLADVTTQARALHARFRTEVTTEISSDSSTGTILHALLGHGADFRFVDRADSSRSAVQTLFQPRTIGADSPPAHILRRQGDDWTVRFDTTAAPSEDHRFHLINIFTELNLVQGMGVDAPIGQTSMEQLVLTAQESVTEWHDTTFAIIPFLRWGRPTYTDRFGVERGPDWLARLILAQERRAPVCDGSHWRAAVISAVHEPHEFAFSASLARKLRLKSEQIMEDFGSRRAGHDWRAATTGQASRGLSGQLLSIAHDLEWMLQAEKHRPDLRPSIDAGLRLLIGESIRHWNSLDFHCRSHVARTCSLVQPSRSTRPRQPERRVPVPGGAERSTR